MVLKVIQPSSNFSNTWYNDYSMNDEIYDDLALERIVKEKFGLDIDISHVVLRQSPVSHTAEATLFMTTKKQLFVYIHGPSRLLFGDIKKTVSRMGLKAELYFPPKGRPQYFDEVGRTKFREVFPGRAHVSDDDIIFYKTLAPYNPALIKIAEIKNGEVFQFDSDATGNWRVAIKFAYRRIKTS